MLISTLVQNINSQLAGELLSIGELTVFIDKAIDEVNTRLNTKFPVLSDVIAKIQTALSNKKQIVATIFSFFIKPPIRTL